MKAKPIEDRQQPRVLRWSNSLRVRRFCASFLFFLVLAFNIPLSTTFPQQPEERAGRSGSSSARSEPNFDGLGGGVLNVRNYGAKGDCKTDDSAAINSAIAASRSGFSSGATVLVPKGCYAIGSTISMVNFEGLIFEGVGSGENASASATSLKWIGASGGVAVKVSGCTGCRIRDFVIDGNKLAGIGIQYTSANAEGGGNVSYNTQIENVFASFVTGIPSFPPNIGTCFWVGDLGASQISESSLRNTGCESSSAGVYQTGLNALNIRYDDVTFSGINVQAWDMEAGSFSAWHPEVAARPTGGEWLIKCEVASSILIHPYVEDSGSAPLMVFPNPGADRGCGQVTIIGGEIGTSKANKKIIDYEQQGVLTLIGNKFSSARGGEVRVVATASPRGFVQTLNFEGDTWGNITLGGTTPGSIIGTNYQMQCFEAINADWCTGVSHYIANRKTVFDGLNLQIMRGALTQSNGTTAVTQYVSGGGYRFDSPNGTLLGGFNVGSSGATGAFLAGSFYGGAFYSSTANRARTGVLNAASSDRAIAFRNSANIADISALSKDASDVVQVGDSPGAKVAGPLQLARVICSGLPPGPANGWLLYCTDCKNVADDSARPGAPCAPGGHGALAKSENSRWDCN